MNSLPLISHRLFVAAIGHEGRVHERPRRQEKPPVNLAGHSPAVALEVVAEARPVTSGGLRPLRVSATGSHA